MSWVHRASSLCKSTEVIRVGLHVDLCRTPCVCIGVGRKAKSTGTCLLAKERLEVLRKWEMPFSVVLRASPGWRAGPRYTKRPELRSQSASAVSERGDVATQQEHEVGLPPARCCSTTPHSATSAIFISSSMPGRPSDGCLPANALICWWTLSPATKCTGALYVGVGQYNLDDKMLWKF